MDIQQKLPSRADAVCTFIADALEGINKEFLPTEEDIFNIRLALEESLINAIKHGNKMSQDLMVDVAVISRGHRLIIIVKDQGEGFDFRHVPDPTDEDKLMKTSGRGIFLMRKTMDKVVFSDNGREVRMEKAFHKNKNVAPGPKTQ